jgi:hypothetical protein
LGTSSLLPNQQKNDIIYVEMTIVKNRKTVLTLVLMTVITIAASAQQYDSESDFRTEPINGGKAVAITKYVGPKQTVRIPPTIQKLPVASIGSWAFYESISLDSIIIPNSVISIDEGAFAGCSRLASITIPNSVTSIGEWAFADTMLTSITIPKSVTSIVNGAFLGCTSLTEINVAADNSRYSSQDGVLFNKSKTVLIHFPGGKTGAYTIPNSVTSIGNSAFRYSSLKGVTIPANVSNIGEHAFAESSITSITIPNSINTIRNSTFDGCNDLTSVTLPNSVTSIGEHAFQACGSLTSISLPITLTSIEAFAFSECANLTSVTFQGPIPSNKIHEGVFDGLGDLRERYISGGPGMYTRPLRSNKWTRQ